MRIKRILGMFIIFAMILSVAACGSSGEANKTSEKTVSDSLTIAVTADPTSLDPHVGKEIVAVILTNNIFATLLKLTSEGEVAPYVAESWKEIDSKTYEFKIREDIKFHDGSKLTAEDVKFSLDRAIESSYVSFIVNYIDSVDLIDEYNIRINLNSPYSGALINLTVPFAAIVPKAVVESNPNGFLEHPIGCGPYEFVEWSQGNQMKMKAFKDYFEEPAKTENVTFRIIPEASQRTIALENGEVDLVYDLAFNDISIIKENENLKLFESPSLNAWYVSMNVEDETLSNKLVRQALRYAVDPQAIIDSVLYGAGTVSNSVIPPAAINYYKDAKYYTQDIEKAKQLLAEAGYPNGLELSLAVAEDVNRVAVCQVLQEQLKQIGVNVKIDIHDASTYYEHANKSEFQLAFYFWICSAGHADYSYSSLLHSSQKGAGGNRSFFDNPEVDKLIEEARQTMDREEIEKCYQQIEEIVYDESPNINLCYTNLIVAARNNVEGFIMHPAGYHNLETVIVNK